MKRLTFLTILFASTLLGLCAAGLADLGPTSLSRTAQEPPVAGFDHGHAKWARVLERHRRGDRIDYTTLSRDRADLDAYLLGFTSLSPKEIGEFSREQRMAACLNAYNAFTLAKVLAHYTLEGVTSIRDVGTAGAGKVWKERDLALGAWIEGHDGSTISLDQLRDLGLRKAFRDARVHAALNDSCLGAPALAPTPFTAEELDKQLDAAARAWMADPLRTRFDAKSRRIEASPAFTTFRTDFERQEGGVQAWIARYAPLDAQAWIASGEAPTLSSLAYDWTLNDVEPPH